MTSTHALVSAFNQQMELLESPKNIAIALSGGCDSSALAMFAHAWAAQRGGKAVMLTVDHQLRKESASEALQVANWCAAHGMEHHILRWDGQKPVTAVQEAARDARYGLLADWCHAHGLSHLLTAHHLDDQLATFYFRLGRGSGFAGLRGLANKRRMYDLWLLRPLLPHRKHALRTWLEENNINWVEDPSNEAHYYTRNFLRECLPDDEAFIARSEACRKSLVRFWDGVQTKLIEQLAECVQLAAGGYATLNLNTFIAAPSVLGHLMLQEVIYALRGTGMPERSKTISGLYEAVCERKKVNVAGLIFAPDGDELLITREPAYVAEPITLQNNQPTMWDGRFLCHYQGPRHNISISTVGREGLSQLRDTLSVDLSGWNSSVISSLPAFWHLDELLCVPHIPYQADDGHYTAVLKVPKPLADVPFFSMNT